jgi:hypothetical protein
VLNSRHITKAIEEEAKMVESKLARKVGSEHC